MKNEPGCPTPEQLEEALAAEECDADLAAHVEGCPTCAQLKASLASEIQIASELHSLATARKQSLLSREDSPAGYVLKRVLGKGGQGIVYEALEVRTGRDVALKIQLEGSFRSPRQQRRFVREIEFVSALSHPNIVRLLDSGETKSGTPWLAMELIEGADLGTYMIGARNAGDDNGLDEALRLVLELCNALQYAHRGGVIHRDLKPGNVLVDNNGHVRVLDFGMARALAPDESGLTISGQFLGSLSWAAPEQLGAFEGEVDVRTDVHAIGLLLFYMLTGEYAFGPTVSAGAILKSVFETVPPRPSTIVHSLPSEVDLVVAKALAKNPEERYPDVRSLLEDCKALREGTPVAARKTSDWMSFLGIARRHPVACMAFLGVSLSLVAIFFQVRERALRGERELFLRDIERARFDSDLGNAAEAEARLWLAAKEISFDATASAVDGERQRAALWALRELYFEHPFVQSYQSHVGELPRTSVGERSILLHSQFESTIEILDTEDLDLVEAFELPVPGATVSACLIPGDEIWAVGAQGRAYQKTVGDPELTVWTGPEPLTAVSFSESLGVLFGDSAGGVLRRNDKRLEVLYRDPSLGAIAELSAPSKGWVLAQVANPSMELMVLEVRDEGLVPVGPMLAGAIASAKGTLKNGVLVCAAHQAVWGIQANSCEVLWRRGADLPYTPRAVFSPTADSILVTCGYGNRIVQFAPDSGKRLGTLGSRPDHIADFGLHYPTNRLVTVDVKGLVRTLALNSDVYQVPVDLEQVQTIHGLAADPSGRMAAVGSMGSIFHGADIPAGGERPQLESIQLGGREAVGVCFSGANIYFAHRNGTIYEFGPGTQPVSIYSHPKKQSNYLAVSPQGMIASVDNAGEICIWNTLDRSLRVLQCPQPKRLSCVAWSKQGVLAAGRTDGKLITLPPGSERPILSADTCEKAVRCVSFSPSGTQLVTGGSDWKITVWSPEGRILQRLDGHRSDIYAVAFSPSGDVLASADRQGRVRIWDTQTWTLLAEFNVADRPLFALAFSADSKRLWIGGASSFLALDFGAIDEVIVEHSWVTRP